MIYILHIDPPLHHARHYVGWTRDKNVTRRVQEHLEQRGRRPSRLVRAALTAGCLVTLVASFEGTRETERTLKRRGSAASYCPAYNARAAERMRRRRAAQRRLVMETNAHAYPVDTQSGRC